MKRPLKRLQGILPVGLCWLLSFQLPSPAAFAQNLPASIVVVVVEGEGAINNVGQRVARSPVVRVEDENHRPVAGAAVVFTLPAEGPSGEFSNGSKTITVITGDDGTAAAHGLKLNQLAGRLQLYVTASYRGLRARTLITQTTNGEGSAAGHGNGKLIAVLAVLGAAAAGGIVAATHKGSTPNTAPTTPPAPTPIGITPGTPTLAPPQ